MQYSKTATEDITFYVYDDAGRQKETWAGTTLGTAWTSENPNAGTSGEDGDFVKISEVFYDDDHDRNSEEYDWRMAPTRQTQIKPLTTLAGDSTDYTYVDSESEIDTGNDRKISWSKPEVGPWTKQITDYQGQLLESLIYDHYTSGEDEVVGDLLARTTYQYSSEGWMESTRTYNVTNGSSGDYLETNYWYDDYGRQVKVEYPGGGFKKTQYASSSGYIMREVYASSEGSDTDVLDSSGYIDYTDDKVLAETYYEHDDVGNVVFMANYQRAAGSYNLGLLSSASLSHYRRTYSAMWYDNAHRVIRSAEYGTNDEIAMAGYLLDGDFDPDEANTQTYGEFTPDPNESDNILVTQYEYDESGRAHKVTSNDGTATVTEFDALGQTLRVIENYQDGTPDSGETDADIVTKYEYDSKGRMTEQIVDVFESGGDQVTRYFYSGEFDADHDGTIVKNNSQVRAIRYPDSTLSDQDVLDILNEATGAPSSHDFIATTYNAAGLTDTSTDQREVTHTYEYDAIGRLIADTVTDTPTSYYIDTDVLAITTVYDAHGRVSMKTSHDDADPDTTGFTDAVNQIQYVYDGWGNLLTEKQENDGAVDANTPTVQYTYDWDDDTQTDEEAPYLRRTKMTYPDGREVYYNYATGIDADVSRLSEIADDDLDNASRTQYAVYSYLGSGTIVKVEHPGVNGGLVLDYGAKGTVGWDQFGRVTTQSWTDDADTTTFDEYKYDYDRASNRVYRENTVEDGFDELYNYDGLGRLEDYARGDLNGTYDGMTSTATQQEWTLDQFGNWGGFSIDHQADGFDDPGDLNQTRNHNNANEIGTISETYGDSWLDPGYDAAGNTIHVARPGDEADANDALVLVYDAWNRLAESFDDDNANGVPDAAEAIIREYEYDGQGRMISWTLDGCLPIENYYSDAWQIVETRYDYATYGHSYLQYVWDERYVDAPVVRYQDINMDGDYDDSNDSVLYYTTDANFNVTALVNEQGSTMERYAYDPYGNVQVLDWDWDADENNSSDVDNTRLYAGYEYEEYTGLYHVRNRAYHPTLGRWAQRDPIGYADGMNLYQYVGANPVAYADPMGLWEIRREGDTTAEAIPEYGDTFQALAMEIGLEVNEINQWLTWDCVDGPMGEKIFRDDKIDPYRDVDKYVKGCCEFSVPNTVLAYWAGEVGAFGKWWVRWSSDVDTLKKRGFRVAENEGWKANQLEAYIYSSTMSKELQGVFFWGHGGGLRWIAEKAPDWDLLKVFEKRDSEYSYLHTNSNKKNAPNHKYATEVYVRKLKKYKGYNLNDYVSLYQNWRPRYKLGIGILWACGTQAAQEYPIFSSGRNAVFAGSAGVLMPHGFHLFGETVDELIPAGKQGTR